MESQDPWQLRPCILFKLKLTRATLVLAVAEGQWKHRREKAVKQIARVFQNRQYVEKAGELELGRGGVGKLK